jgi:hypothetical protein
MKLPNTPNVFALDGVSLTSDIEGAGYHDWLVLPEALPSLTIPPAFQATATPVTVAAAVKATPPTPTLYVTETGDSVAISVNDIHQGQIGDCFLLAALGEMAIKHPTALAGMIKVNTNGTETVTLYGDKSGHTPGYGATVYKPVAINVSNVFPTNAVNNGATQGVQDGKKEIWVQVMEKAIATMDGGYGMISNGGNPMIPMEQLTGHAATSMSPTAVTAKILNDAWTRGDLITFDTGSFASMPFGLVKGHAYMFEGMTKVNGADAVTLGNPWGTNQPAPIPLSQLSKGFVEIDFGHFS